MGKTYDTLTVLQNAQLSSLHGLESVVELKQTLDVEANPKLTSLAALGSGCD